MSSASAFPSKDKHKRVTAKSNPGFLERLSDTAGGTVFGIGLFFLSVYVLFTNEGRALRTASSLDEGLSQVVSLGMFPSLDPQNNNRLVHLSAQLRTSQPLHDPNYGVWVQAVKLQRQVEMYQWVEYQESRDHQENGETKTETTYTYNTEWKSELISSRSFDQELGHQNPSAMAVESVTVVAPQVTVGPFTLSRGLVEQISNFQTLHLKDVSSSGGDSFLTVDDDYFYHTQSPRRPEVGDVRVRFAFAGLSVFGGQCVFTCDDVRSGTKNKNCHKVSVVAMQRGEHLTPFRTKSGDTLELLHLEELSAEEVFAREQQSNSVKTWGLRAAGWVLMFLSIQLTTRILYALVDWVPVLRELVSVGLKLLALCVSCSLALLTIAAGWLFYRPLAAAALAALALLPVFLARSGLAAKKKE